MCVYSRDFGKTSLIAAEQNLIINCLCHEI